ncbi:MAG: hypothetical protein WC858_05040 [Parcubacteria group bacterium]|jgi:hypothetical protein
MDEARERRELAMQSALSNQQRQAENAPKKADPKKDQPAKQEGVLDTLNTAKSAVKAAGNVLGTVKNMLGQIKLSEDWFLVFFVIPFGLLKDIFDIAFAAIPGVGIAVSFLCEVFLLILTVIGLLLASGNLKDRRQAKYILGFCVSFISEALPGIGWLPLAFIESSLMYGFLLFDRAGNIQEQSKADSENEPAGQPQPEPQYAKAA